MLDQNETLLLRKNYDLFAQLKCGHMLLVAQGGQSSGSGPEETVASKLWTRLSSLSGGQGPDSSPPSLIFPAAVFMVPVDKVTLTDVGAEFLIKEAETFFAEAAPRNRIVKRPSFASTCLASGAPIVSARMASVLGLTGHANGNSAGTPTVDSGGWVGSGGPRPQFGLSIPDDFLRAISTSTVDLLEALRKADWKGARRALELGAKPNSVYTYRTCREQSEGGTVEGVSTCPHFDWANTS